MALKKRGVTVEAALWKRIASLILDLVFINAVVAFPMRGQIMRLFPKASAGEMFRIISESSVLAGKAVLVMVFISILAFLYFVLFEFLLGQSPGMMIFNLKVEKIVVASSKRTKGKLSSDGLSVSDCILRSLFVFPFFPFYLLWVVDPVYIFWSGGRRLMERFTATRVVEEVNPSVLAR